MVPVGFVLSCPFQLRFQRVPAVFAFALPHVVRVLTHSRCRSSVPVPCKSVSLVPIYATAISSTTCASEEDGRAPGARNA